VVSILALGMHAWGQVRRWEPSRDVVLLMDHAPGFSLVSYSVQICLVLHASVAVFGCTLFMLAQALLALLGWLDVALLRRSARHRHRHCCPPLHCFPISQ
jgi:ABC-type uncharacterized transport system permease subunit